MCCVRRNVVVWKAPGCGDKLAMCLLGWSSGAKSRNSDYASIQDKCLNIKAQVLIKRILIEIKLNIKCKIASNC